ncbi:MAG: ExbD/TolR family protein [Acidiferrobacterales bacterium]
MRYRRRRFGKAPTELDITAFMNLMVILVPFLLITAVFSRITILELNLPPAAASKAKPKKELQLEIVIRTDSLDVGDRNSGLIKRIRNKNDGYDLKSLSQILQEIKARFPDKNNAMILAETTTSYDSLVQVMDTVRIVEVMQDGSVVQAELFPDISIGDAPLLKSKRTKSKS